MFLCDGTVRGENSGAERHVLLLPCSLGVHDVSSFRLPKGIRERQGQPLDRPLGLTSRA